MTLPQSTSPAAAPQSIPADTPAPGIPQPGIPPLSPEPLPAPKSTPEAPGPEAPLPETRDQKRCRLVENALYRRARGYTVKVKKPYKIKEIDYDPATGRKLAERELLRTAVEEEHIPADLRMCAYFLNNRAPDRWQEHPEPAAEPAAGGLVAFPALAELLPPEGGEEP